MSFTTPPFLILYLVVFSAYWLLDRPRQNQLVLAASLVFYGWWDWRFLSLFIVAATVDYVVALLLTRTDSPTRRRVWIVVSLLSNLGLLGFFKYYNFFAASASAALQQMGIGADIRTLRIILPVGISFYTFQALSYTIDVYRRQMEPIRDPVVYLCYISFFPQLVAGPIERATSLLPQFAQDRRFDREAIVDGCRLMLWGFFKKMVVADSLAPIVNAAYQNPSLTGGWDLLWATYAFSIQIYCDFSGYTDIARGCARTLGFSLMRNFSYPYFAKDIREFWRRWHISLSTWFRDYLYVPLGGNRLGVARTHANVMAVFVLSGFWHGANWTFLAWGLLHGLFFLLSSSVHRPAEVNQAPGTRISFRTFLRIGGTFHLVVLSWIFFRAETMQDALIILGQIAGAPLSGDFVRPPLRLLALAGSVLLLEWCGRFKDNPLDLRGWSPRWRWTAYYAVTGCILLFAELQYSPFIYFQF